MPNVLQMSLQEKECKADDTYLMDLTHFTDLYDDLDDPQEQVRHLDRQISGFQTDSLLQSLCCIVLSLTSAAHPAVV